MGLAAAGSGASAGFEDLLQRLLLERRQNEVERAAKVDEGQKNRQLDLVKSGQDVTSENNQLDFTSAQRGHDITQANNDVDNANQDRVTTTGVLKMRPIGAAVTPEEKAAEIKKGAATQGNYDWQPPKMGASTPEGEVGPSPERISWTGTPEQVTSRMNAEKQPSSTAQPVQVPVTLNGKQELPMRVNGRLMLRGKDITDDPNLSPAQQPDRTLVPVQGPDGQNIYKPRGEAAGMEAPLTAQTRAMSEGASMVLPMVDETRNAARALDKNKMFGPIMSRLRDKMTQLGTVQGLGSDDPDAQQRAMQAIGSAMGDISDDPTLANDELAGYFSSKLGLLMTGMARVHGGTKGGGSPQMLDHFKSLISGSSTLPMFLGRLRAMEDTLGHYKNGPGGGAPDNSGGRSDDELMKLLTGAP